VAIDFKCYKGTLTELKHDIVREGYTYDLRVAERIARQMVPAESVYQAALMKDLKKRAAKEALPIVIYKAAQGRYSRGGVADIQAVIGGVAVAVEVKRPVFGKTSKLQEQFLREFNEAGGVGCVAVWPEDLDKPWAKVLWLTKGIKEGGNAYGI